MPQFSFQPLQRSDFPMLSLWLTTAHVARWWADDPALDAIESQYGGVIDRTEPSEVFIAHHANEPIGLIQRYRFDDYPHFIEELVPIMPVPALACSIDYLIGLPEMLGKGLAAIMIKDFVALIWQLLPPPASIIVPVNIANIASWRALERAGFHRTASGNLIPDNAVDDPAHFIYRIERAVAA